MQACEDARASVYERIWQQGPATKATRRALYRYLSRVHTSSPECRFGAEAWMEIERVAGGWPNATSNDTGHGASTWQWAEAERRVAVAGGGISSSPHMQLVHR